jgi:hypothetical protein
LAFYEASMELCHVGPKAMSELGRTK